MNWLNRSMTSSVATASLFSSEAKCLVPKTVRIRSDKALAWIYENLRTNRLAPKLQCLLSDSEHLVTSYEVTIAFFHSRKFVDAMFECLRALERRDPNILTRIDGGLYTMSASEIASPFAINRGDLESGKPCCDSAPPTPKEKSAHRHRNDRRSTADLNRGIGEQLQKHCSRIRCKCKHVISQKLRPWVSLPDVRLHNNSRERARVCARSKSQPGRSRTARAKLTAQNLAFNDKKPFESPEKFSTKLPQHSERTRPSIDNDHLRPINLVKCDDIKIHLDRHQATCERSGEFPAFTSPPSDCPFASKSSKNFTSFFGILPSKKNFFPFLSNTNSSASNDSSTSPGAGGNLVSFAPQYGEKIEKHYRRTIFDESLDSPTQFSPTTAASEADPAPAELSHGQSLIAYLQEAQRHRFNVTDLERENAHFNLSDAIIAAIEEIKCNCNDRRKEKQSRPASKRKSRNRRMKTWSTNDDERLLFDEERVSDGESNGSVSVSSNLGASSDSESESSHVSSDSDSSATSNAGNLKRLKVRQLELKARSHTNDSVSGLFGIVAQY